MPSRNARRPRHPSARRRRPILDAKTTFQARKTIKALKLGLFGVSSQASLDSLDRLSRAQVAKYGHLGLRAVPVNEMPAAVDALFARMDLRGGQRLLEIGPGPQGGFSLIAALMGLDAIVVEYERPFLVDVDLLRQQLSASPGTEAALAQIAGLTGSVEVSLVANLNRLLDSYRPLIAAMGGSIRIIPGDFADAAIQRQVTDAGPVDHIVCTDVISPMSAAFSSTTAMLTTGEGEKILSIVHGLAGAARSAQTLYTGMVVPEQSDEFGAQIAHLYGTLEAAIQAEGRTIGHEAAISPSSAAVLRSRLYQLGDAA